MESLGDRKSVIFFVYLFFMFSVLTFIIDEHAFLCFFVICSILFVCFLAAQVALYLHMGMTD